MYIKGNTQYKKKNAGVVKGNHKAGGTRKLNWFLKSYNGLLDYTEKQSKMAIRINRCSYDRPGTEKRNYSRKN